MNKNKLLLLCAVGASFLFILAIFMILRSEKEVGVEKSTLSIWTIGHNNNDFEELAAEFREDIGVKTTFDHTNFETYNDYQEALLYELATGTGPDIFMLNNSESLFLEDKIVGIDPSYIQPEEFRKKYLAPFSEELVTSIPNPEKASETISFLMGVPTGFETLGLFYDRRSFIGQDLSTWSGLGEAIQDLKERNNRTIPLGIGHGSSVYQSPDIFTQFLINNGSRGINDLSPASIKNSLANYQQYGEIGGKNEYNSIVSRLETLGKNNIALFSTGEIKMLIGFPSILKKIKESGFSKSFLSAEPFPKSLGTQDSLLVNYNYFVLNKDSLENDSASSFLSYLVSDEGAEDYYEIFTDKIPSHSLLTENLDQKFDPDFNVTYKDLLRDKTELVSYNKGIINIYERFLPQALNNLKNGTDLLLKLQEQINCKILHLNGQTSQKPNCEI